MTDGDVRAARLLTDGPATVEAELEPPQALDGERRWVPFPTEILPPIPRAYVATVAQAIGCDASFPSACNTRYLGGLYRQPPATLRLQELMARAGGHLGRNCSALRHAQIAGPGRGDSQPKRQREQEHGRRTRGLRRVQT